MMQAEGLVTLEQGRGTFVCKLTAYTVTVTVAVDIPQLAPHTELPSGAPVTGLQFDDRGHEWQWRMTVLAADAGRAAVAGLAVARRASPPGIDFTRASTRSEAAE